MDEGVGPGRWQDAIAGIMARPDIRRAIRALGWTSKRSPPGSGSRRPARSRLDKKSTTAPACCARAMVRSMLCCASNRPTRPPSSATWIRLPAATAFASRSWAPPNYRGRAPSYRSPLPRRGLLRHPGPTHGAAFRPPAAAMRRPRLALLLATAPRRDCSLP